MEKKAISSTLFMVLLITTMTLAFNIQRAKATVASGDIVVTTYSNTRLLKLDRDGNIVWNIDMGSKTMEACWNLIDGTIYLVSVSPNRLTKLDSNGNILWDKDLSFMSGGTTNLDVDPNDGSVYVSAGEGAPQAGVYKYDSSGNQLWHQQVNFQSVAVNPIDGSVYANSWIEGVYKYDSNGNFLWNTYIGGYQTSYGHYSIAVDPSDGSVVATTRWGGPVVKLDPDGNIVWQTFTTKDLGGVAVDSDRNAVYVTASNWPSGIGPFNLYKLNLTNGNIEWERPVSEAPGGSPSPQLGVDHFDGSIYTGEYSESSDFSGTLYKREPDNGNIVWSKTLGYSTWGISIAQVTIEWKTKANLPIPRRNAPLAVFDGKIYAFGGIDATGYVSVVHKYDPAADTWTNPTSLPEPRGGSGVAVVNDKIYVIGGSWYSAYPYSQVWEYDPIANSWNTAKSSKPTIGHAFGVAVLDNKIYTFGGWMGPLGGSDKIEVYDPSTDTWITKGTMPWKWGSMGTAVVNGKFYLIGGGWEAPVPSDFVAEYDPVTNTWTTKAPIPTARSEFANGVVAPVIDNKIYIVGGVMPTGILNSVEIYDPSTDMWSTGTPMPTPLGYCSSAVVANKIYVTAGANFSFVPLGTNLEGSISLPAATPIANFTYSPIDPYVGETVTFDASASYDPNMIGIKNMTLDFGDDSPPETKTAAPWTWTHLYTTAGTYTVTLTVWDLGIPPYYPELSDTETKSIKVGGVVPLARIYVDPPSIIDTTLVPPDSYFSVRINVSDIPYSPPDCLGLVAFEFHLKWNASLLGQFGYMYIEEGEFLKRNGASTWFGLKEYYNVGGYDYIYVYNTQLATLKPVSGNGTLATVWFWPIEAYGSTVLDLYDTILLVIDLSYETAKLNHTSEDGFFANSGISGTLVDVDINPDVLNLRSKGEWITAYIELPAGHDVNEIDVSSIMLNNTISVDSSAPIQIGDHDSDGTPDLMVKFNRAELILYIYDVQKIKYGNVTLALSGQLNDGTPFEGDDVIRVMLRGDVNNDRIIDILDLALIARAIGTNPSYPRGTGWDQWNPNADVNADSKVDINDLCISGSNYGATIP